MTRMTSGTVTSTSATTGRSIFVPAGSTLHVWAATGTGPWHQVARLTVPIQYGSSG